MAFLSTNKIISSPCTLSGPVKMSKRRKYFLFLTAHASILTHQFSTSVIFMETKHKCFYKFKSGKGQAT